LWILLGGAAGLKLAFVVHQNTPHPQHRISVAIAIAAVHMLFLIYTHFAYHELAEGETSDIISQFKPVLKKLN